MENSRTHQDEAALRAAVAHAHEALPADADAVSGASLGVEGIIELGREALAHEKASGQAPASRGR